MSVMPIFMPRVPTVKSTAQTVALMKKFVYGVQTPTAKQKLVADMDKSGEIDKKDLNLLKSML